MNEALGHAITQMNFENMPDLISQTQKIIYMKCPEQASPWRQN
jgi:hypothetical protein